MNENNKKYQINNKKTEDKNKDERQTKIVEKRSNHILFESKYKKPYSKEEKEQKVENIQGISRIKFGNSPEIYGKGIEKGINYRCNKKEDKSYDESNKMNKCIISYNRRNNNLEEKFANNLITNNDIPKSKEIKKADKGISQEDINNNNINKDISENYNYENNGKNHNNTYNYNSCYIHNIKSLFVAKEIFSFIDDINFEYKLFEYSKLLKKKFEIDLKDYIKRYSEQLYYENLKDEPLIESSSSLFEKVLSNNIIYILQDNLEKDKFKYKYYKISNKPNLDYSSIYYMFNNKNFNDNFLDNLKELNIDFNKIKAMSLNADKYTKNNINFSLNDPNVDFNRIKAMVLHPEYFITDNYNYFLKSLFSLDNIKNYLLCLKIYFGHKNCPIKSDSFEEINDMKVLKYLYLININLDRDIEIKLDKLKILYCNRCKNANSFHINCKNLKKLYYINNRIEDLNNLKEKCEKLETLDLSNNIISNIDISKYANSKELKVLNLSNNEISNLNFLKNVNFKELKELNLGNNNISDINALKSIKFGKLKKIDLSNNKISNREELKNINLENLNISI